MSSNFFVYSNSFYIFATISHLFFLESWTVEIQIWIFSLSPLKNCLIKTRVPKIMSKMFGALGAMSKRTANKTNRSPPIELLRRQDANNPLQILTTYHKHVCFRFWTWMKALTMIHTYFHSLFMKNWISFILQNATYDGR